MSYLSWLGRGEESKKQVYQIVKDLIKYSAGRNYTGIGEQHRNSYISSRKRMWGYWSFLHSLVPQALFYSQTSDVLLIFQALQIKGQAEKRVSWRNHFQLREVSLEKTARSLIYRTFVVRRSEQSANLCYVLCCPIKTLFFISKGWQETKAS